MNFQSRDMTRTREVETVTAQGLQEPGSPVPGPSASTDGDNRQANASARHSFLMESPESGARAEERTAQNTTRKEFKRLFYANQLPEARRLAETMITTGVDRVAWVHNLGYVCLEQGNLREAYSLYLSNAHLLDKCTDFEAVAKFCNTFAMVSQGLGDLHGLREFYDRALYYYRQSVKYYELASLNPSYALNNIGWLLISMGFPERAFEYLDRTEFAEPGRQADVLVIRALAYESQNDLANALECLSDAINLLDDIKDVEAKSYDEARKVLRRVGEKL